MTVRTLLSPTEGALAEKLGDLAIVSSVPEQKGQMFSYIQDQD